MKYKQLSVDKQKEELLGLTVHSFSPLSFQSVRTIDFCRAEDRKPINTQYFVFRIKWQSFFFSSLLSTAYFKIYFNVCHLNLNLAPIKTESSSVRTRCIFIVRQYLQAETLHHPNYFFHRINKLKRSDAQPKHGDKRPILNHEIKTGLQPFSGTELLSFKQPSRRTFSVNSCFNIDFIFLHLSIPFFLTISSYRSFLFLGFFFFYFAFTFPTSSIIFYMADQVLH